MMEFILNIVKNFNIYAEKNQMIAGAISLWSLGVISYFCKDIPNKIWKLIKKYSTTTVTLTSQNDVFYLFLKWYENKGYSKKGRYIKIGNGRWGDGKIIKSLGYGTHYFWYHKYLIILSMRQMESNNTDRDKDEIKMLLIGRNHKIFDIMFEDIISIKNKSDKIVIKKFNEGWWIQSSEQRPRKMYNIFIETMVKTSILNHLNTFLKKEEWYLKHDIPYQTGIILYGPPGTGKTSLIKAIADYLDYQMHILSPGSLYKISEAMFKLPEKSLVVIEDIDTNKCLQNRKINIIDKKDNTSKPLEEDSDDLSKIIDFNFTNLSDVLNSIDGVQSNHGRILILTTNHIEGLDPALLRPGRIDLKVKIDYVNNEVLNQFFKVFFPHFIIPNTFKIKDKIPAAEVQNLILKDYEPENILELLGEK